MLCQKCKNPNEDNAIVCEWCGAQCQKTHNTNTNYNITIQRKKNFAAAGVSMKIFIDNRLRAAIRNAQSATFTVLAGEHKIRLQNSFLSSKKMEFDINIQQDMIIVADLGTLVYFIQKT